MKTTRARVREVGDSEQRRSKIASAGPQPVPGPVVSAKICWDKAEALERLGGDEDLLREICGIFLEESPRLMQKLKQAIAESDSSAVMRAAHSLKGELGYLGAAPSSHASRALEDMGHDKNLTQAKKVFALLERELADLHLAMRDSAGAVQ